MLAIPTNKKVDLIDGELMKLDPAYAAQRESPSEWVLRFYLFPLCAHQVYLSFMRQLTIIIFYAPA